VKGPSPEGPFTYLGQKHSPFGAEGMRQKGLYQPRLPTLHPWLRTCSEPTFRNARGNLSPVSIAMAFVKPDPTMLGFTRCVPA
jgi:hypothetical protein